ncbi:MAG: S26 family signal peptidase [Actinomycetota bacterium]|nr:S26 family signal peptidase [Actinomycetota bacterium]
MALRGHYPSLLIPIAAGVTLLLAARGWRRLLRVEVQGMSMAPGLLPGDRLLAIRGQAPRVGDVVTTGDPRHPARTLVKRVVVLDADRGVELAGDNATASTDSRTFGAVPPELVTGRVVWRYWPPERRGRPRRYPALKATGGAQVG